MVVSPCPYLFFCSPKDPVINDIVKHLTENNIQVYFWPHLPELVLNNKNKFPLANYFKENVIHFPV